MVESRKKFLRENHIIRQMIFYTWYDPMSGNFYFSTVPKKWEKMPIGKEVPFGCTVNRVYTIDDIIEEFVNDTYKGRIPLDELIPVDPSEDDDDNDEDFIRKFILNVYWTEL